MDDKGEVRFNHSPCWVVQYLFGCYNPLMPYRVTHLNVWLGPTKSRSEPYKEYGERAPEAATTPVTKNNRQSLWFWQKSGVHDA